MIVILLSMMNPVLGSEELRLTTVFVNLLCTELEICTHRVPYVQIGMHSSTGSHSNIASRQSGANSASQYQPRQWSTWAAIRSRCWHGASKCLGVAEPEGVGENKGSPEDSKVMEEEK